MGCVSSKILTKSGSFQESVVSHSLQRRSNNVIEEIILSGSKQSNGQQFLALLCTSGRKGNKEPEESAAELPAAKIETINVSELLAGLEEEESNGAGQEKERQSDRQEAAGRRSSSAQGAAPPSDGGAAGRARSFRTVEEFDALVTTKSGCSSERATTAPAAPEQAEEIGGTAVVITSSHGAATGTGEVAESSSSGQESEPAAGRGENAGEKRRARARQLGELKVPTTFDFSKSGSLRDWLLRGGQIFSPGSYVTPKFGTAPAVPAEHGEGEKQQRAVFDPEMVAQFERAMEQLSEEEERVLTEILEALELDVREKDGVGAATASLGRVSRDEPASVAVPQN